MKSIVLINPPNSESIRSPGYYLMPLSLLYLAGSSRLAADTHILDLNVAKQKFFTSDKVSEFFYIEYVKKEIERISPDFVGVTCLFSGQMGMLLKIVEAVKQTKPSAVVVVGGMHPTIFHKDILLNCQDIDAVAIGEGEDTLRKMLEYDKNRWTDIPGLAFRDKNKQIIINEKTSFIEEIDTIPSPAYDLFDLQDYKLDSSGWYNPKGLDIGTSVPVLTSRSCPFKCNFCSMNLVMGTRFRARSAECVFKEIEYLYHERKVCYFNIMDDNFSLDRKRILQVCKYIIDAKLNISFDVCNGTMVNTLDDEVIDALAQAGFCSCFLSIESGSAYIRNKVMNKNLSDEKIRSVINTLKKYPKIHLAAFFIIGMPEETRQTLDETYELIDSLPFDSFKMAVITPFPGTRLFEQCERDNLFITKAEERASLWNYSSWYLRLLNESPPFFLKPYAMEIWELEEYARKFEALRHTKHLACPVDKQTLSVKQAIEHYRKNHPEAP